MEAFKKKIRFRINLDLFDETQWGWENGLQYVEWTILCTHKYLSIYSVIISEVGQTYIAVRN